LRYVDERVDVMGVLVLLRQKLQEFKQQMDQYQNLLRQMDITIVDDYDLTLDLAKTKKFNMIVAITFGQAFPDTWNVKTVQNHGECPTMFITGASELNVLSMLTFIGTLHGDGLHIHSNPLLEESLAFIEENLYSEDLSLEKVASHVYVSKCHYSRLFQKHVGKGFKEYVISKRIDRAKLLLRKGSQVTDTCYSVGYNDLTHFGRIFKRTVGMNPSVYRQKSRYQLDTNNHEYK
jgi:YesN/AraC family two-component response regulator